MGGRPKAVQKGDLGGQPECAWQLLQPGTGTPHSGLHVGAAAGRVSLQAQGTVVTRAEARRWAGPWRDGW